jgi:Fe-S cluster assembly protein SufB
MSASTEQIDDILKKGYDAGFITDIEQEYAPPGLSEEIVAFISKKKEEPEWLLEWRLKAYRRWLEMEEPTWAKVSYPKINYQDICYYAAPKSNEDAPKSLDEVDPQLLETYEKLGIPLHEREILAGVAVDAVFDSVSVATTFREKLSEVGVIFMSFSEAVHNHPELIKKYLGSVVPVSDNFYAALNSAVFSDGSFVYIPKGVRCPMELSTYFRINAANTGQFERTLIVADEGSYVSYLEGCTAPMRDENQLHAAVVELVAHKDAQIKYSTVQNWYPGDENGKGGIFNFVTKRGLCEGERSKISWTQVETGSAITWKYPSCILKGDDSIGEFYSVALSNHRQQADTGTKMIHLGKNTKSTIISLSRWREDLPRCEQRPQLHSVRFAVDRRQVRRPHGSLCRRAQQLFEARARGDNLAHRGRPAFLLQAAGPVRRGRGEPDRQRLCQASVEGAANGIRSRGAEAPRR